MSERRAPLEPAQRLSREEGEGAGTEAIPVRCDPRRLC